MGIMNSPIKNYRQQHQLSLRQLAHKLGIPEVTLRSLENGNRTVTAERAVALEGQLGIPRAQFRPDLFA